MLRVVEDFVEDEVGDFYVEEVDEGEREDEGECDLGHDLSP